MKNRSSLLGGVALGVLVNACGGPPAPEAAPPAAAGVTRRESGPSAGTGSVSGTASGKLDRDAFNKRAFAVGEPVFWEKDTDGDGDPDANEVKATLFGDDDASGGAAAIPTIIARVKESLAAHATRTTKEDERQRLIGEELDQIRPVMVRSDLRDLGAPEKEMVRHLLRATHAVDRLHARQKGLLAVADKVKTLDPESRAMFRRNWGPRCVAPRTENNAACTAIAGVERLPVDVYPTELQQDAKFCAGLEKRPDSKKLFEPFTVVRAASKAGTFETIPYAKAYADDAKAVIAELEAAAKAVDSNPKEKALATYLRAAAKAFGDNSWYAADEAWAKMSGAGSQFYVRVAPDETYWEPCSQKAGFHFSFARMSASSQAWQQKLEPVKQDMEVEAAKAIGAPYAARKISFHLPEFIEVVWNGGDDRDAIGATIGQSLPNWGPVADKNRGRTVAMANLYTDDDSLASRKRSATALLCEDVMPFYPEGREPGLLSTILHEATHNLGPSHEYKANGKTDAQWFGGGLASTMEEMKAQTGALFFLSLLKARGIIDEKLERTSFVDDVVWSFGHISRGMVTPTGERKPYSQLAAVQVGFLMDEGALTFNASKKAANGTDMGCFSIDWAKVGPASAKMMTTVGHIKATGDKKAAEALTARYIDAAKQHDIIRERSLREPRPSFLYSIELE